MEGNKGFLSRANAVSWRPGLKDSEIRSRSVSPIPSYYVGSNNPESPNQQGSESFSELEGDMPEQAMFEPKNASAASSLSPLNPQGIPSLTHNKVTVMPPRITTNFLDLPGSVQEPISPPLLRAYQGGHSRGESLGLGLSTLSSSQQPTLRRDEVLKELLSPIATTTMSSRQELGIGAPIVSRITLPPNSKLGKGPIEKRETSEDISKETFKSKNPRTSIPSRPLLCLPPSPSPAYNCSSGLVSSPENMDETDAKVGMRNDRARRSGLRSFHNGLDEKEPVPMQPASMTARRVSREFGAKHVIERYPGASVSTTTAVPPRGRRHGSIAGGSWATRNPLNGVRRSGSYRNVDDNGSPMTPVDFEVAQRQRLRSDSTASTIAGSEYDLSPYACSSRFDVHVPRRSWLTISLIVLSIYSTAMSGIWLFTAMIQPRWGHAISSGGHHAVLQPSTASLITTLFAKSIEMSFVTVFVAFLGQVLSRRAFIKERGGVTLAEMSMRNWVVQPGSILTQWEGLPQVGLSFLGLLSILATLTAILYTTASDAMVTPKLKFGTWHEMPLTGFVRSSYANPRYVSQTCPTPLTPDVDLESGPACLDVEYSGKSYHNLLSFMEMWQGIHNNGTSKADSIAQRPEGTAMLHDNTTVTAAWVESDFSNVTAAFQKHGRIVNNISLAIPHPGVYSAATHPINGILQPHDLQGVGEYSIRASVVSPAVNVLCVNLDADELAPLVYTRWPTARTVATGVPGHAVGASDWERDVPPPTESEFLNRTIVDEIFRWGPRFGRRPPVWRMLPIENNIITNTTIRGVGDGRLADAIYLLGKPSSPAMARNYTLCEMRSWLATSCSTHFSISGTKGGELRAVCDQPNDPDRYDHMNPDLADPPPPSGDWKNMVDQWRLAINLNGGETNSNTSNSRILTGLAINTVPDLEQLREIAPDGNTGNVDSGGLPALLPSISEALAVLASSTLMIGAIDTPFNPLPWPFSTHELGAPGHPEVFRASIKSQEFVSGHTAMWQAVCFYPILLILFGINTLCLVYLCTSLLGEKGWCYTRNAARKMMFWRRSSPSSTSSQLGSPTTNPDISGVNSASNNNILQCPNVPGGLVTDYTEPSNLFALAINSPPSISLAGSCGSGPESCDLVIPFRVGYSEKGNHYFFEEVSGSSLSTLENAKDQREYHRWRRNRGVIGDTNYSSDREANLGPLGRSGSFATGSSYRNLSVSKTWL